LGTGFKPSLPWIWADFARINNFPAVYKLLVSNGFWCFWSGSDPQIRSSPIQQEHCRHYRMKISTAMSDNNVYTSKVKRDRLPLLSGAFLSGTPSRDGGRWARRQYREPDPDHGANHAAQLQLRPRHQKCPKDAEAVPT